MKNEFLENSDEFFITPYYFHVPSRKVWLELCSILDSEGFSFTECRDEIRFIEVNKDEQKC